MNLRKRWCEVVIVEKALPPVSFARVYQRFLRGKIRIVLAQYAAAGVGTASTAVRRRPRARLRRGRAAGDDGFQAANIDRIERRFACVAAAIAAAQLRLVLDPGALDSATEIDHGFFLLDQGQVVGQIRQRLKPLIRIEDVVFGFVWCERGRGIVSKCRDCRHRRSRHWQVLHQCRC